MTAKNLISGDSRIRSPAGALNRLVRVQLGKGVSDKGKMHYQLRVENDSPLILNGVAATSGPDATPRVLSGISLSPHRSMTVPASEEVVTSLGLEKGHRSDRARFAAASDDPIVSRATRPDRRVLT